MPREEIDLFIADLASHPGLGVAIEGTGGCRKVRVAPRGKGKSGGYRVITFFTGPNLPIFLITVFGKAAKANLTRAERNQLGALTKILVSEYRSKPGQ